MRIILLCLLLIGCVESDTSVEEKATHEIKTISQRHEVDEDIVRTLFLFYIEEKHFTLRASYFNEESDTINLSVLNRVSSDKTLKVMADIEIFCSQEY